MTNFLQSAYTFNGQISYSREEIDKALNRKANIANLLSRTEILERFSTVTGNILSVDAKVNELIQDIASGNITPFPIGTVVDGELGDIRHRRFSVENQRPEPADLTLGELAINYNENSPFLFALDGNGEIRRLGGVQFGTSLPDGTAYSQSNPATYPEQRTQGEYFYNTNNGYLYLWTGSIWDIISYGDDTVILSNLATQVGTTVDLEDLQDVTPNGGKVADDVVTWDGANFIAQTPLVTSVNTQTGAIVLDPDDLDDTSTTNKFTTAADIAKLGGIDAGATDDQTATEIRDALQTLTLGDRLDASAIQNLPGGGGAFVSSVNTLSGAVTITTDNIADSATNSYVQTVLNTANSILVNDNTGTAVELLPPTVIGNLIYNPTSNVLEWIPVNINTVKREVGGVSYTQTEEFGFYDPSAGLVTVSLSPSPVEGQTHFVKNFGASNNVFVDTISETLLPGQQVKTIYDGTQWQII